MTWASRSSRVVPTDWKRRKAAVLKAHPYVRHTCGHGDADEVDHLLNVARGGTHGEGAARSWVSSTTSGPKGRYLGLGRFTRAKP